MRVLITGYYGAGNFGDDIMLEAFCEKMKEVNPKIKIDILKMFERDLEIKIDKNINIIDICKFGGKIRSIIFTILMLKYDIFLWVGGTCFTDEDGDGLYDLMKIVKRLRKRFGYIGVGVGNLTKKDRIDKANFLIKNCHFISLRDSRSYQYVKRIKENNDNIYLTDDLAYLFIKEINLTDKISGKINANRKIVLSWRNLINYKTKEEELALINKLLDYMKELSSEEINTDVIILPLDDRKDCEINKFIYDQLKLNSNRYTKYIYKECLTPREKIKLLIESDINISARLHGIFVSELSNIKTIAISYSVKIDEFLDSIGKYSDCINISDLSKENLKKIYDNGMTSVNDKIIDEKIKKSEKNICLLCEYLLN